MNADQLKILCKGLEDAMTGLETMIQFSKTQADRIAELEKKLQESALDYISICSQADEHYARVQELEKEVDEYEELEQNYIKVIQRLQNTPQTNNKNRSWSDICDEATAVWDSLDTSNQSNIECARAWFLEGYHQALTRGQE